MPLPIANPSPSRRRALALGTALAAGAAFPGLAQTTAWPSKSLRMSADVVAVLQTADAKARLERLGVIPVGGMPAQLTATMRTDQDRWSRVI